MPLKLEGSCHCGAVTFEVDSNTPHPYQLCYCSICRKTAGGGGFSINIMGIASTMKVKGESSIGLYNAVMGSGKRGKQVISECERKYCTKCGTFLYCFDERWPELIHPFASVINTDLPVPPSRTHIMLGSKASWVVPEIKDGDETFQEYPKQSIEDWHKTRNLWIQ